MAVFAFAKYKLLTIYPLRTRRLLPGCCEVFRLFNSVRFIGSVSVDAYLHTDVISYVHAVAATRVIAVSAH
jgi:hypothetical protein